jgi:hypothetical protein
VEGFGKTDPRPGGVGVAVQVLIEMQLKRPPGIRKAFFYKPIASAITLKLPHRNL